MSCGRCGLQWDIDDQKRPQCRTDKELSHAVGLEALHDMRKGLEADIVHKCSNCTWNRTTHCEQEQWTSGPGVDRDALAVLMNVDNSKCTKWGLKR